MSARWKAIIDRAAVATFVIVWAVMLIRISMSIYSEAGWIAALLGVAAGYLLADFLAGTVHWIADRFFDPDTPLLGPMLIGPFREHHEDALAMTRHDFFEVSGNSALLTLPWVALLAASPIAGGFLVNFLVVLGASVTLALFLTNQFHSWAHSPSPPNIVKRIQASGLILTPHHHALHHRDNHDRAYCVTSGWLNPLLDRVRLFDRLEYFIDSSSKRRRRTT